MDKKVSEVIKSIANKEFNSLKTSYIENRIKLLSSLIDIFNGSKKEVAEYIVNNPGAVEDIKSIIFNSGEEAVFPPKVYENFEWLMVFVESKNYYEYNRAKDVVLQELINKWDDPKSSIRWGDLSSFRAE